MSRAPFQVLVIPFRRRDDVCEYAVLQRTDDSRWQFIAGGGEDDETPEAAARREAREEARISEELPWQRLDSVSTVPRSAFQGGAHWPSDLFVVPEHCFAVDVTGCELYLSHEHTSLAWLNYEQARQRLTWQSNQNALWELRERLRQSDG